MTTALDLIETARRSLLAGSGEGLNQADTVASTSATSVTLLRALSGVTEGTVLSVGLEAMRVWEVTDEAARTLEVLRGYGGSTPATHASGDLVRVNPPHTDHAILAALNDELRSLSGAGLYRVRTLDLTASAAGAFTYNLASDVEGVLDVRVDIDSASNAWPRVQSWTWLADMPTSEFASGNALRIDTAVPSGRPVRVFYRAALGTLSALSDDVLTTTGLRASAHDIPPIGALWRLTAPQEVERNQTQRQGDARRAEEVPPGSKMRSTLGLQQLRQSRIREELANQSRDWPSRSH